MTKNLRIFRTWLVLALCLSLSACNLPAGNSPSSDIEFQQTSVAQTVAALQTQLAVNETPVINQITTNPPGTDLPAAIDTPTLTVQPPTPTITFTPAPTFRVGKVVDVTFPDNTVVKPNTEFTKTWRLTNTGTGTWTSNFKLIFVSGDAMGAPASTAIGQAVPPGGSIDVSVKMKSPAATKTYKGMWMMQTDKGANFGLGANADGAFWVQIKVDQALAVTGATVAASPNPYTGACAGTINITANVTVNTSGKITYYFITSMGNSPTYELSFDAAGSKTTPVYALTGTFTGDVTVSFYNDYPNHQACGPVTVTVTCTP